MKNLRCFKTLYAELFFSKGKVLFMKKITVIGAGSFGTALAILLTDKGYDISIWRRSEEQLAFM